MENNNKSFLKNNYFNVIDKHDFKLNGNNICLPINCKNYMNISTIDIMQLEAHRNYTLFYFADGNTLLVAKTMKEYMNALDGNFVRIHNKFVINLRYLLRFELSDSMCVLLKDGKKLAISRRRKKEFVKKTENIFGGMMVF